MRRTQVSSELNLHQRATPSVPILSLSLFLADRRRPQRRRRHRLPPMSRTSSFSSITDSTMSLNIITVSLNMDTVNFLGISIVGQSNKGGDGGIYVGSIMKGLVYGALACLASARPARECSSRDIRRVSYARDLCTLNRTWDTERKVSIYSLFAIERKVGARCAMRCSRSLRIGTGPTTGEREGPRAATAAAFFGGRVFRCANDHRRAIARGGRVLVAIHPFRDYFLVQMVRIATFSGGVSKKNAAAASRSLRLLSATTYACARRVATISTVFEICPKQGSGCSGRSNRAR